MHTRYIRFELDRKGIPGKGLLRLVQGHFGEQGLEPLRFAIVKANRAKVLVEAIVLERGK